MIVGLLLTCLALFLEIPAAASSCGKPPENSYRNEALRDRGHFVDIMARNWIFECGPDFMPAARFEQPALGGDYLRNFSIAAVREGLCKLEDLNGELAAQIIAKTKGRPLKFNCRELRGREIKFSGFYSKSRLPIWRDELTLGSPVGAAAGHDAERYRASGPPSPPVSNSLPKAFRSLTREQVDRLEHLGTVFHEFLHFAELPMDPSHNTMPSPSEPSSHRRETDMVYACGAQAYPTKILRYRSTTNELIGYSNTRLACETCATADLAADEAKRRAAIQKRGKQACLKINAEDYAWDFMLRLPPRGS